MPEVPVGSQLFYTRKLHGAPANARIQRTRAARRCDTVGAVDASSRATLAALAWLAVQFAVPVLRLDPTQRPPFSPRFSWSMFAGRPLATCSHDLRWTTREGAPIDLPLPPPGHAARRVLAARTPDEFRRIVPLLSAYADDDRTMIAALDDLVRRHRAHVDPRAERTLVSTLDCRTARGEVLRRSLRLEAR